MKLRGIEFNTVFWAPGTFGYFGEENSVFLKTFFRQTVFVSRPTTMFSYTEPDFAVKKTFRNRFQSRTKLSKPGAGVVLSKEDVSGPGLEKLLDKNIWQKKTKPFVLSVVSLEESKDKRISEMKQIATLIGKTKNEFKTEFGILICLNDPEDNDYDAFVDEVNETLELFSPLSLPIICQFSLSFPPDAIEKIAANKNCDAIAVSTSISWERFPKDARKIFFRMDDSPISRENGGYTFGKYIEQLAVEWTRQARKYAIGKPFIVGGGILNSKNIDSLARVGANGFLLDKSVFLRPWNIPKIISRAKVIFAILRKIKEMQDRMDTQ